MLLQPGETYEALDDNEVALQNMMGNRFMGFFEAQITEWKGKLGTVRLPPTLAPTPALTLTLTLTPTPTLT